MKQLIASLLKRDREIEEAKKKYLVDTKKFKPHITLVYPFEINHKNRLHAHIKEAIKGIKGFRLSLKGIKKSTKEYYLYLLVDNGRKEVIRLHNRLNAGILKGFRNKKMPKYIPHLSLGKFNSKDEIDRAVKEMRKKKVEFKERIDCICLLDFNKDYSLKRIKRFKL